MKGCFPIQFLARVNFCTARFCSLFDRVIMSVHYDVMTVVKTAIECVLLSVPWNTQCRYKEHMLRDFQFVAMGAVP